MSLSKIGILGLTVVGFALAGSINVVNPSFETLPPSGLPLTAGCSPAGCQYDNQVEPPGWTAAGNHLGSDFWGQFQPGDISGNPYFNSLPDGITIAYIQGDAVFSQTVAPTVQLGVTYTLSVDLAVRKDVPGFVGQADLLINGNRYFATGTTPSAGDWSTFTATYTGLAADVGQNVTIELSSSSGLTGFQADLDNVQLSDNSTAGAPEPASIALFAAGLVALWWRRCNVGRLAACRRICNSAEPRTDIR